MKGTERFFWFCRAVLPRAAGNLLMLVFAAVSVYQFRLCSRMDNPAMAVPLVFLALASAAAAALFLVRLYLPSFAEKIVFSWFYPKRYLKKAPVVLSRIQGMIAAGRFQEAEQQLLALESEFPHQPETTLMLMELAGRMNRPGQAVNSAEAYFSSGAVRRCPAHFRILMLYADLMQQSGREAELMKRLETELRHDYLNRNEKKSIRSRLNFLQDHLQEREKENGRTD